MIQKVQVKVEVKFKRSMKTLNNICSVLLVTLQILKVFKSFKETPGFMSIPISVKIEILHI